MTIQYPDIAPHVAAGKTDAEIAAILQADPRTVRNVPIERARQYLVTEWGIVYRDLDGTMAGPLAELYYGLASDSPYREPVRQLITHLLDNPSAVEIDLASNAEYASAFFALLDNPTLGLTADHLAALEALHGGRKYKDVTADTVARVRLQHKLETAQLAANSAFAQGSDWTGIVAAFEGVA